MASETGTSYDRYKHVRDKLFAENNRNGLLPNFSFESYAKTYEERLQLKLEKSKHKEWLRQSQGYAY